VSYFSPQNARKIAPRSVCSFPNSTQKVSRKRGRVTGSLCPYVSLLDQWGRLVQLVGLLLGGSE
jgi:hypothetical protein